MDKVVTGRFAPTPSGRLHLGNIFAAMISYLSAKSAGGRWLLRVEDLDAARLGSGHVAQMLDDLTWFGFEWDGDIVYQSERDGVYAEYFESLNKLGLIYPCYCSRGELAATAPHGSDGQVLYSGKCRGLLHPQSGKQPSYRIIANGEISFTDKLFGSITQSLATECTDFILRRADGVFAYHLAVVVDDALTNVTEVVRGADLMSSAPRQIYLQRLLGFPQPKYGHIPMLANENGERLSKRDGSSNLAYIRSRFSLPNVVIGRLAHAAGITKTVGEYTLSDLIPIFSWDKMKHADYIKLEKERTFLC